MARRLEYRTNRDKFLRLCRLDYRKLRHAVIQFLGGKCKRCRFPDARALQIDHKNGGGCAERRKTNWRSFYAKVMAYPKSYQLLCANCNAIKRIQNGEHRKRAADKSLGRVKI